MSDEQKRPDMKRLWQSQLVESSSMSLQELQRRLSKMNRIIRIRALTYGLVGLIFTGFFGELMVSTPPNAMLIAKCISAVGAAYYLYRVVSGLGRASAGFLTEGEPQACAAFYRSQLERERDSSRGSAIAVPLAFSAFVAVFLLLSRHFRIMLAIIWVLFVPFFIHINLQRAKSIQRELDTLNANFGE